MLVDYYIAYKVFFSISFSINGALEKAMDQMNEPPPNDCIPWNTLTEEKEKGVKVYYIILEVVVAVCERLGMIDVVVT